MHGRINRKTEKNRAGQREGAEAICERKKIKDKRKEKERGK